MKKIAKGILVFVLVSMLGWINLQAAEEEIGQLWQPVKVAVERVKKRMALINEAEKNLAKTDEKKEIENIKSTLQTHNNSLKKEIETLCLSINRFDKEFEKWIEDLKMGEENIEVDEEDVEVDEEDVEVDEEEFQED